MAWVAVIGAAVSYFGSQSASKNAKRAGGSEAALRDRELRLAESQDARGRIMFDEYQQTYLPRERQFVADTFSNEESPEAAAARATTDVRAVQAQNKDESLRTARRLGVNPTSGAYAAMENDRSLRDTALDVTARDMARRKATDTNFQRQYTALSLGKGLPSQAGALTANASNTVGGLADAAARHTDQANALSAQAGQDFGRSLGELAGEGAKSWKAANDDDMQLRAAGQYGTH